MANEKKEDPRIAQARQRAERIAKSGPAARPDQFFNETVTELKKTTWPTQQVLTKSTYVVLAFIVATAIWVGGIDALLTKVGNHIFLAGTH